MKAVIGYVKAVEYGTVEVLVPEDASDEEIAAAVLKAEEDGNAVWNDRKVSLTEWEENPDYCADDIDND